MNFRNMMELGCTVMLAMAGAAIECHQRVLLPEDTCWEFGILTVFTILWSILCVLSRGNKGLALWGFPERTFARPFFLEAQKTQCPSIPSLLQAILYNYKTIRLPNYFLFGGMPIFQRKPANWTILPWLSTGAKGSSGRGAFRPSDGSWAKVQSHYQSVFPFAR